MSLEKRYPPSARKLKNAKKHGDVVRSRRLTRLLVTAFVAVIIVKFLLHDLNLPKLLEEIFSADGDFNTNSMLLFGARLSKEIGSKAVKLFFGMFLFVVLVDSIQSRPSINFNRLIL